MKQPKQSPQGTLKYRKNKTKTGSKQKAYILFPAVEFCLKLSINFSLIPATAGLP